MQLGVSLLVDDGLGQFKIDISKRSLQNLIADLAGLLSLLGLLDLGLGGFAQLLDGVVLGGHLGELIVHVRQLALLGLLHVDLEGSLFVLVLAGLDGGAELVILAGLHAAQCGVQTLDEVVITNGVRQALGGSLLDLLTVNLCGDVDDGVVTGLHLALGVLQFTEAFCKILEGLVHVFLAGLDGWDGDGDFGEVRSTSG